MMSEMTFMVFFEVTKEMVETDVVYLTFRKLKQNIDMLIDNVQLLRMKF